MGWAGAGWPALELPAWKGSFRTAQQYKSQAVPPFGFTVYAGDDRHDLCRVLKLKLFR